MSETMSHRLVRISKSEGTCSCGKQYWPSDGPIRAQHAAHKSGAPVFDQAAMAAHDETTWKLYTDCINAGGRRAQADDYRNKCDESARTGRGYLGRNLDQAEQMLRDAYLREVAAKDALDEHEKSYTGWARFWCVPNGHIHSSQYCSTCYPTTQFYLAHEVSGMDEAAAVKAQGPALCTVCFPSAPVEWTVGLEAARKALRCPGSGRYMDSSLPHRSGYVYGNWATCSECGERAGLTPNFKIRAHKPKEA